jgi:formylglycine-generating enzyme required for sulfatase activity
MFRPIFLGILATALALAATAQDTHYPAKGEQIYAPDCMNLHFLWEGPQGAPCSTNAHEFWLRDLEHWRAERHIRTAYDPSLYELPALRWTQSAFIQPQMMVQDRYLYDPVAGRYTVDRYLDDLDKRNGGIDAVLVWSTYPNMGIDDRNQLDMVASMPGGLDGVRQMVADFHRRGVRVLFPMMMWDQGTRQLSEPWPQALAARMKFLDADGINGDTQDGVPQAFSQAAQSIGHPIAFEPEGGPNDEDVSWNLLTWGYYTYPFIPTVDRYKWLEPRHMVNVCDRWNQDHTDNLQFAFFNGTGFESWENIWGIWNGLTPRDAEATRRVAMIERAVAPFLVSADWEPHYPMHNYGVYASRWPLGNETVWTIVNRNSYSISGAKMNVSDFPGTRYFDLYHGVELKPEFQNPLEDQSGTAGVKYSVSRDKSGAKVFSTRVDDFGPGLRTAVLSFDIEARGYSAILAIPGEPATAIKTLMQRMAELTVTPLAAYSREHVVVPQQIVDIPKTKPASSSPEGMVRIPGGEYDFKVHGTEVEGSDDPGVDVQYPWEDTPRRFHEKVMHIAPFFIDKYPVTNAQFKKFLENTHYVPRDPINFLRDWKNGAYPQGWPNRPVTWVSLEDARAYAKWAGKRLPHEWEWQLAAQGNDGRIYPWGSDWNPGGVPTPDQSRSMRGPDPVDAHSDGASPYGVVDMVGNVWQWTDEFTDEHTRAAILRGGEYYQPQGSIWYFPQAYRNDEHSKLLLMAPGYDRSGGVGFRCVVDAQ